MKATELIPPHDGKVERAVLAAIILNADNLDSGLTANLSVDSFYFLEHREIFSCMFQMKANSEKIDIISLCSRLSNSGKILDVEIKIAELSCEVASTVNFTEWVTILVKLSARRRLLKECQEITIKCHDKEKDVKELLSDHSGVISEISGTTNGICGRSTAAIIRDTMQMFKDGMDGSIIVKSFVPAIDGAMIHTRRQMHVLSAFPGTGKTSYALSVIASQIQNNIPSIIFCKESSSEETLGKMLSIYSGISYIKLLTGLKNITPGEMAELANATAKIKQYENNLYIRGGGDYKHSIDGMRVELKRMKEERGEIGSVWIDYLQNMEAPAHLAKKDKTPQVEYNVEALKDLFIEFDCAGTVLSQINREGAKFGKPKMHHLKYASAIEAEAHIISFLYRENINDESKQILETEWYSEKTRMFAPFTRVLMFNKKCAMYTGKGFSEDDRP